MNRLTSGIGSGFLVDSDDTAEQNFPHHMTTVCSQLIGYLRGAGHDEAGAESTGCTEAPAGGTAEAGAEPAEAGACSVGLQHRKG